MIRLFIGLPISEDIRTLLHPVYEFLSTQDRIVKSVAPQNYHITVKFLGECEGNVAKAIENTFMEISVPAEGIPYTLSGLGTFPDMKKPTVLWAGLTADQNKLSSIYKNVERFSSNFRFKEEKRVFIPHLTIARIRNGRKITGDLMKYIEKNKDLYFGDSAFNRLTLFSSNLTPDGPIYKELKSITF